MNLNEINAFLDKIKNKHILVIGDVMIDSYIWGKVERISPEAPVPIVLCNKRENRLGGAANVALNLQSLGAIPVLCGIVGDDDNSTTFLKLLKDYHLSSEGIFIDKSRPTTIKTRIIGGNQQLLRIDEEITTPLSEVIEEKFIEHILKILRNSNFDAIIFQDYDKGSITENVIRRVVKYANEQQLPVLVDPKHRNFHLYNHTTLFKPNFKEFCEGIKVELNKNEHHKIFEASKKFLTEKNITYLLLTLSEKGIIICSKDFFHHLPAHVRDIADVSGAGDTVISMASLCMSIGMNPYQIAAMSNLAGGLVCEKVGVVPITTEMLRTELLKYSDFNLLHEG